MDDSNTKKEPLKKRPYSKPKINTEDLKEASAQGSGGGGGGKTCNGGTNGGRKDTAGAGCSVLLT